MSRASNRFNERPVDGRVVQFSGGEPTIPPQFFEILSMARDMGFTHVQAATNGIELAHPEFAQKAKAAGLNTLYLQFDGATNEVYRRTRGEALLETKLKVVESCPPSSKGAQRSPDRRPARLSSSRL